MTMPRALWLPTGHHADNGRTVLFSLDAVARHTITAGEGAHGIVFTPSGRTTYVTNQMAGTVSVIDVPPQGVIKTLTVGTKPNGLVFRPA